MRASRFVVIGSSRSGTTTLHHCLRRHPDVFVPARREPRFFAFENDPMDYRGPGDEIIASRVVTTWKDFSELYRATRQAGVAGDISPAYLSSARAAPSIRRHWPSARIIAILRNPVERAISSFRLQRLDGFEPVTDLREALSLELSRRTARWSYVWNYMGRGDYLVHLQRYFDLFDRRRIKVFLYEDWHVRGGTALLAELLDFLDVPHVHALTCRIPRLNSTARDRFVETGVDWYEPDQETIEILRDAYRPQVAQLEALIDRDLAIWNL